MASEDDKEYLELESEGLEEDEADDDRGNKSENITDLFDVVISNPSPADKRAHHNALERKRRDHIKDSFVNLRECVPGISSDKASRAHILKKATDYIVMMKQKNMKHRNDIDSLRQQSRVMEEQVHALERIKATSMYAQSTQGLLKPGGPDQTNTITAPPQTSVDTLQQATEQLIQSSKLESADNDGGGEGEVIIEQVVEEYPETMEGATT